MSMLIVTRSNTDFLRRLLTCRASRMTTAAPQEHSGRT
jgi:hypothetical protein